MRKLTADANPFLLATLAISVVLLACGAAAISLPLPSEFMRPLGVSATVAEAETEAGNDPYDAARQALIGSGLGLGAVALILGLIGSALRRRCDPASLLSLALSNFALGWYCIPIWANGILRVPPLQVLTEFSVDYRAPYVWFGPRYQAAVLVGAGILALAGLAFALGALAAAAGRQSWAVWLPRAALPVVLVAAWQPMLACVAWVMD